MNLLIYSRPGDGDGRRITEKIKIEFAEEKIEILDSIKDLAGRLQEPKILPRVAVLHASTREELLDLVSFADLLQDMRIVLILPDRDPETVARGHRLRPRFLSDREGDFSEVAVILKRLLRQTAKGLRLETAK